jgi:hypothetical protein
MTAQSFSRRKFYRFGHRARRRKASSTGFSLCGFLQGLSGSLDWILSYIKLKAHRLKSVLLNRLKLQWWLEHPMKGPDLVIR